MLIIHNICQSPQKAFTQYRQRRRFDSVASGISLLSVSLRIQWLLSDVRKGTQNSWTIIIIGDNFKHLLQGHWLLNRGKRIQQWHFVVIIADILYQAAEISATENIIENESWNRQVRRHNCSWATSLTLVIRFAFNTRNRWLRRNRRTSLKHFPEKAITKYQMRYNCGA